MHELLIEVKNKYKEGKYDEAIKLLDKAIERCILYPEILVQKASCLQLSGKNTGTLEEIENLYQKAFLIDDNYYNVLIEFANFQYAVMDKTELAKVYFEKAFAILRNALTETVLGIAKCIEEIEDEKVAIEYLTNIGTKILDDKKISHLVNEFREIHE